MIKQTNEVFFCLPQFKDATGFILINQKKVGNYFLIGKKVTEEPVVWFEEIICLVNFIKMNIRTTRCVTFLFINQTATKYWVIYVFPSVWKPIGQ